MKESTARRAPHLNNGGRFGVFAFLFLLGLLVLPAMAIARSGIDPRISGGYAGTVSFVAYWVYARDKEKARAGQWRVSESTLHFMELIGGWPGAFIAQQRLRHKCSKLSYQLFFWFVVVLYQLAAFDFLQQWRFARAVLARF